MDKRIAVKDHGEELSFTWENLYSYCGQTQIIATAIMFRLFRRAFADLVPAGVPDREGISLLVGFPGVGLGECAELVTRVRSRHPERYTVDPSAAPEEAPRAGTGFMYFEVTYGGRTLGYYPPQELFNDTFRYNVKTFQGENEITDREYEEYLAFKRDLAQKILDYPEDKLFTIREVPRT